MSDNRYPPIDAPFVLRRPMPGMELARGERVTSITNSDSPYAASHNETVLVDSSGGITSVDLPLVSGGMAGDQVRIKKTTTDTNNVRIRCSGSDTLDGSTALLIGGSGTRAARTLVVPDTGSDWAIVGSV